MNTNRNFKDSVFTSLFKDPAILRELYYALGGVTLPPDVPVFINTLENVLFMDLVNDISFEIGGKLVVLIEHQSTINPNIALRLLLYISKVLEKRINSMTIYSKSQVPVPWPEFYVLYNGKDPFPDEKTLRLSELFENPKDLGLGGKDVPLLELQVRVININEGKNDEITSRCKKLSEYIMFMGRIRAYGHELGNREEAIGEAIKYCKVHDILREYLEIHGSEVLSMILTEWNTEDAIAYARKESREEGLNEGRENEREYILNLISQGLSAEEIKQQLTKK